MTPENPHIEVAVALPVYQTFTYSVPEALGPFVTAGMRVLIPFGRRRVTGYILGTSQDNNPAEIKPILEVLDEKPLFPRSMIPFFQWISDYYKNPIGNVIKNGLPGGLTLSDHVSVVLTDEGKRILKEDQTTPIEREVLRLLEAGPIRLNKLSQKLPQNVPAALIQSLQRDGRIS